MNKRKFPTWILTLLVLALVAAACGGDGDAEAPADSGTDDGGADDGGTDGEAADGEAEAVAGGSYSIYQCEPKFLGPPQTVTESCGAQVAQGLWSPLVTYTDDIEPIWGDEAPDAAAASIEGNEDSSVWTVEIKEGWTFHNGDTVTAQDYVDAWNWGAYGPNAADANYFFADIAGYEDLNPADPDGEGPEEAPEPASQELSGLEVIDETTFEVTLAQPFRQYPLKLGYTAFNPMPQSAYDDIEAYNESPIGQGPYMMAGPWEHDVSVSLETYPDYAGTPGNADEVTVQIYSDINTAYNDLIAGNLDYMDTIPPERKADAEAEFGERLLTFPSSYFGYIGLPTYQEQFADPNMRKALSMAIDRQAIIDEILLNGTPADDMMAPVINAYREDACDEACTFDPEEAQRLYDEAGGLEGTVEIWFNGGAGHEPVYEAVANMWRQNLGIEDVEFQILPFAEILTAFEEESVTGPFRLAWIMDYPSAQNYLGNLLACNGSSNYTGYCNEEADALVQQANAADSAEQASDLYQQADDMFIEDLPIIPFYYREEETLHSEGISNITLTPFSRLVLGAVEVQQ
jgi:ABC-type transport system substrate-binding protein